MAVYFGSIASPFVGGNFLTKLALKRVAVPVLDDRWDKASAASVVDKVKLLEPTDDFKAQFSEETQQAVSEQERAWGAMQKYWNGLLPEQKRRFSQVEQKTKQLDAKSIIKLRDCLEGTHVKDRRLIAVYIIVSSNELNPEQAGAFYQKRDRVMGSISEKLLKDTDATVKAHLRPDALISRLPLRVQAIDYVMKNLTK